MSRDMVITVKCDGKECHNELFVDLDNGDWNEIPDMKIEKELDDYGWYLNIDGDYCPNCADKAREEWLE